MIEALTKTHQAVWKSCLDTIRKEVTAQSFDTWFEPIRPIQLENKVLTIEVPSPFFYEWLEEYYVEVLRKAIYQELGSHGKLEYSIVVDKGEGKDKPYKLNVRNNSTRSKEVINRANSLNGQAKKIEFKFENPFNVPIVEPSLRDSQLNKSYTFDTLIEGDCNRLARSAGLAITDKPGITAFNPLVVYGGVGLGKTHLAQSIGNEILTKYPGKFVLYVSSEQFTAQFIDALRNNSIQNFTNYYLQVDVLIVDDIQFLANKEKTQENFFHLFNRLHQSGKQIIMTSDCPPKDLQGLQERLLSRFKWGLTADIQKPDFETRIAIIQTKTQTEGVFIPDDVIEYIAKNVESNIRELEGVLISLIATSSFTRTEINLDLAKNALKNIIKNTDREITIDFIQQTVSDYFKISIEDLKSKTRKKDIATARQVAMFFTKSHTKLPLKIIGDRFGGRDHSAVIHASKAVKTKSENDAIYSKIISELSDKMGIKSR